MQALRIILAALAILWLPACNLSQLTHDSEAVFEDPAAYQSSDRVIGFIRKRDFEGFFSTLSAEEQENVVLRERLQELFDALPGEGDLQISRFYSERRYGEGEYEGVPVYLTVYDVESGGAFGQLTIAVYPENGVCCVTSYAGFSLTERRPSTFNDLTLEGKGWLHYLIFALAVGFPVLMIGTAVLCYAEKRVRHRWLWIPFILVGLWGVSFNWTTGQLQSELVQWTPQGIYFKFISIHLLGAGAATAGYFQPWILTIGTPVGAIAYYVRRLFHKSGEQKRPYEAAN